MHEDIPTTGWQGNKTILGKNIRTKRTWQKSRMDKKNMEKKVTRTQRWSKGENTLRFSQSNTYEVPSISFHPFFVWTLLLIVHTWNSSPLRCNLLRVQCTFCNVPTTSGRPYGSPLVWACQWLSSQPLSSPQLFHNDSL